MNPEQIVSFILNTRWDDLPDEARRWGRRCLLERKFRWLVADRLPASRAAALEALAWHVDQLANAEELNELLAD